MDQINSLPTEILVQIFKYLPEHVSASKVCVSWSSLVDYFFGLPLEISQKNLGALASIGISECVIIKEGSSLDNFLEHQCQVEDANLKWKHPWLLKGLVLKALLPPEQQNSILFTPEFKNLNKLSLNWLAVSEINVQKLAANLQPILQSLEVCDDSELKSNTLVNKVHEKILDILQYFSSLISISLEIPEPTVQKLLTKGVLDFLRRSRGRLQKLTLDLNPFSKAKVGFNQELMAQAAKISNEELEADVKALWGKRGLSLKSIRFIYGGRKLHQLETWLQFFKQSRGLEILVIELSPCLDISATVPTAIARSNKDTLKVFEFTGGPTATYGIPVAQNVQHLCLDFNAIRECSKLEHCRLDLYEDTREIRNLVGDPFPPSLRQLRLANFVLCFEEIYSVIASMQLDRSVLHLESVWIEDCPTPDIQVESVEEFANINLVGDDENDQEESSQSSSSTDSSSSSSTCSCPPTLPIMDIECQQKIIALSKTVLEGGKITCFRLGRLSQFPKNGIVLGEGEQEQILRVDQLTEELHICSNRLMNPCDCEFEESSSY